MTHIFSLQGSMAVGKTTALDQLRQTTDYFISSENNAAVLKKVQEESLDKTDYHDYLKIQAYWIDQAVKRWQENQKYPIVVQDLGAEEIEFYTLNYPLSLGKKWDIAGPLAENLTKLRTCQPERILFLEAPDAILTQRKVADTSRRRGFFDYQLTHLYPLKRRWFAQKDKVDFLDVSHLSQEEMGHAVQIWVEKQVTKNGKS